MNLGENNNFFRESFRGFNKDDVAEYITKLSKDYTANEEKYKEHIAKLTAEIKAKTDEFGNFNPAMYDPDMQPDEIQQGYRDEIVRLTNELNDKDAKINDLQVQLESGGAEPTGLFNSESESKSELEEIIKYQELIANLTKEIEQLKEENEKPEIEYNQANQFEQFVQTNDAINQLSFQLSECESEKLFLFNLLKKFILILDIESARDKDIEYAANISDIAPKLVIAEEIESELHALAGLKNKTVDEPEFESEATALEEDEIDGDKSSEIDELYAKIAGLESENAELKAKSVEHQEFPSDEKKIYESITADLGNIIYSAKKTAEEISSKAKTEAEDIVSNAQFEADAIIGNANAKTESIIEEGKRNMADFKEKFGFIKIEYESMVQKYKELSEDYILHLSEIDGIVNIIYDTANRESSNV